MPSPDETGDAGLASGELLVTPAVLVVAVAVVLALAGAKSGYG
jgi:hypothetical protein